MTYRVVHVAAVVHKVDSLASPPTRNGPVTLVAEPQAQAVDDESEPARCLQRPRALVLVPTRELAVQVLEVAKRLSRVCKFSSCGIIGGEDYGKQRKRLAGTVDIVVATPGEKGIGHSRGAEGVDAKGKRARGMIESKRIGRERAGSGEGIEGVGTVQ